LLEEEVSTLNGQETTMLEVSFDLRGLKHLALTHTPTSILMFKKSTATKLEDVDPMMLAIPMEVILDQLMEALEPARPQSKYLFT